MKRNARFWIWYRSGPVKITLRPGQRLSYSFSERTDEGYHGESETLEHDGDQVIREYSTDARDCDGRFQTFGTLACKLENLRARRVESDEGAELWPEWDDIEHEQRDESAERMGY